mmetsp:Transcript_32645/g.70092  ORF Transcript_32645/g.70092 Transcript_32645/m.70092 type:complete len:178 (+) Transcript_32645:289-822(+)
MWSISLRGLLLALLTVRAVAAASRGTALNGVLLEEDASDASCGLLQIDASAASASKAPRIKREAISSIEDASAAKEPVTLATTNAATNTTATATSAPRAVSSTMGSMATSAGTSMSEAAVAPVAGQISRPTAATYSGLSMEALRKEAQRSVDALLAKRRAEMAQRQQQQQPIHPSFG